MAWVMLHLLIDLEFNSGHHHMDGRQNSGSVLLYGGQLFLMRVLFIDHIYAMLNSSNFSISSGLFWTDFRLAKISLNGLAILHAMAYLLTRSRFNNYVLMQIKRENLGFGGYVIIIII